MIKKISYLILLIGLLYSNQIEIQSDEFIKKDNYIISNKDILLFKENYFARANSGKYNQDTKELELFGDVFLINNNQTTISNYAKINLGNSCANFDNFFISDSFIEVWLKSKNSSYINGDFIVKNASVSSCDVANPEWSIDFKEGIYNTKTQDLVLKGMVLRFKNIPIFYMPYFAINTDDSRKTGFLVPKLSIKSKEAIHYEQPFFWAINHRMDLELRPQIRTNRGYGIYSNFRFVDSPYSKGNIGVGYFKEFNSYLNKEELKFGEHYGFNMHYERDKIFNTNNKNQEGLYLDFLRISDIDYLNLSSFLDNNDEAIITSKFNYFYTDNKDYFGLYAKYYQDTSSINQDYTLQEIPNLHYHRFYDTLFDNHINYKADFSYSNFYRREGSTLNRFHFYVPIEFNKSLFDDYINFVLNEEFELGLNFYNNYSRRDDYNFNSTHSAFIYTNLFRKYDYILHNINFGFGASLRTGSKEIENEFFIPNTYDDLTFNIELSQIIFSDNDKKLKHSLTLRTEDSKFNILSNQLKYYFNNNFNINNTTEYSFKNSNIDRFFIEGVYTTQPFKISSGFYYNKIDELLMKNKPYDRFLTSKFQYEFMPYNIIYSQAWFNLNSKKFENYSIGFTHKKRCINYSLEFKESTTAKLTQMGVKSVRDRGVYLKFNLYPIGGVRYNFALRGDDTYDF
ncbi:LPS assembly protein LptD [Campylobacter sp. 2018MI10]|uniref:LPS-assembly protein LptD n=4 Tax=unclassified Campylobacter TaxID=2593542 RepID=UPI001BD9B761|nr:LPS assembly protein LptD [Campylobacter sp. 2018MI10]MBT0884158.1 LPS assembly protein LptD [Campylobacter sp. 2018MI10]